MTSPALDAELSSRTHHLPAAVLVVLMAGGTVAASSVWGDTGLLGAVAVLQLALVAAWVTATGIRGFLGSLGVGLAAAAGADAALLLPERPEVDWLLAVLGLGFLAGIVHQMTRPSPRRYLVASLAGVLLLVCSVSALAVLLGVGRLPDGDRTVVTAVLAVGAALLVGHVVDLVLPRPAIAAGVPRGLLGLVLGVVAAVVVAWLRRDASTLVSALSAVTFGAALGGVAALMAVGASYVVAERTESSWALRVVQAVLPLAAAAPTAFALALNGLT